MIQDFLTKLSARHPRLIDLDQIRHSAVCITLLPAEQDQFDILFEVRSSKIDSQPGDICFPGGMLEEGERPEEAALRELQEELLVQRSQIRLIGPSDYLKMPSLAIWPFVVMLERYEDTFSCDEVAEVFRVPLAYFLEHEPEEYRMDARVIPPENFPYERIYGGRQYRWRNRSETILFYEYEGHHIWGLTAKILHAFVKICREQERSKPDKK